jgi:hypothetical protein
MRHGSSSVNGTTKKKLISSNVGAVRQGVVDGPREQDSKRVLTSDGVAGADPGALAFGLVGVGESAFPSIWLKSTS